MNAAARPIRPLPAMRRAGVRAAIAAALLGFATTGHAQEEFTLDEPAKPQVDPEKLAELTEIRQEVEIGAGYVSDDSFRFGRYSALEQQGAHAVLNMQLYQRGAYDGPSARYMRTDVTDLGLSARRVAIEFGEQGRFALRFDYDEIPAFRSDATATPFRGSGSDTLTLAPGWIAAANTAGMVGLVPALERVPLEQQRERWGIGFDRLAGRRWKFTTRYDHEQRDGNKSLGAVIGNSGGNPRAALLPEPIDYDTDRFEAAAAFVGGRSQFQLRYQLSLFKNGETALRWQNPYSAIAGWDPSAGFPGGFGQISLPPDNRFHQLDASAGLEFGAHSRLTAALAVGRMSQDDAFLPYTVNPVLAASITQPLPRESLDGRIDTTLADLKLSSRVGKRFDWSASLRFDDRDNHTPRDQYVYIGGDSQLQDTSAASSRRRYNEPYSFQELQMRLDVGWRLAAGGRLSVAAQRKETERSFSEREDATENTFTVAWSQDLADWLNTALRLERADRSGSTYHGEHPFLSGYDPGFTSTVPGPWENPPDLRKFHLANRERDRGSLMLSIAPSEAWSLDVEAARARDDYESSALGLTRTDIGGYTVDIAFTPSERLSAYAFYSRDNLDFDQNGQSIGGATRIADAANPARAWQARHRDRVNSAGVGVTFPKAGGRLDWGLDLNFAESRSDVDVSTGAALLSAPLPRLTTRLESVWLRCGYRLPGNLKLNLRYGYERFRSTDWALDGVEANQLANVILLGDTSPDYSVHVVALTTALRF